MKQTIIILSILLILSGTSVAHSITGTVTAVVDGDTIRVHPCNPRSKPLRVRLAEIDAPESKQAYGAEATRTLKELILNKTVVVGWGTKDRYGRIIGQVFLNRSTQRAQRNINEEMIKSGLAWRYVQYSKSKHLSTLQQQAREQGRGLWQNPAAVSPWSYRLSQHPAKP